MIRTLLVVKKGWDSLVVIDKETESLYYYKDARNRFVMYRMAFI